MAKDKNYMPQSTAGLIRYFEGSKKGVKIRPEHVLYASVILVALEIALKFIA